MMHDLIYQLDESLYEAPLLFFFTNFIDNLAETGTASFIFEMKVLRGSMTLGKAVLPECISPLL